jgi:hypothetical protein
MKKIPTKIEMLKELKKLMILCDELNIERLEEYLKISVKI